MGLNNEDLKELEEAVILARDNPESPIIIHFSFGDYLITPFESPGPDFIPVGIGFIDVEEGEGE